jgi:hypothetical protein
MAKIPATQEAEIGLRPAQAKIIESFSKTNTSPPHFSDKATNTVWKMLLVARGLHAFVPAVSIY